MRMGYTLLKVFCFILLLIPPGFSGRSKEKCLEYSKKFQQTLKESHISSPSIDVGKEPTEPGEFPHMILLDYVGPIGVSWHCAGSLINENFVLTAAHCTKAIDQSLKMVRIGEYNIESTADDGDVQQIDIAEIIVHPEYKPPEKYNDIALLRLATPVKLSEKIRPVCLYEINDWPKEQSVSGTGWGQISYGGPTSSTLLKVYLDYFTVDECNVGYTNLKRALPRKIDDQTQICAGGKNASKDLCQGDAGGPLQYLDKKLNSYFIIGITSLGRACGIPGQAGVFTRVSYYVPWIESIIWQ